MANSIALAEKYLPILDEKYKVESKTAVLDAPADLVRESMQADTIYLAKMALDGLGDYDRNTGFVSGDSTFTWESHTFTQDRGRQFQIDAMDDMETIGLAYGRLAGTFIRRHSVPELDAYRFSQIYNNAGTTANAALDASTIIPALDTATETMDNGEVPMEGRILFISPKNYNLIKNADEFTRNVDVQMPNGINRNFDMFDDMIVVKVPQSRFYTDIILQDGTTGGQEAGGYIKDGVTPGYDINFLIVHPSATLGIVKHRRPRIFSPNGEEGTPVNPNADAWQWDYRVYHDIFFPEEKTAGIYGHRSTT